MRFVVLPIHVSCGIIFLLSDERRILVLFFRRKKHVQPSRLFYPCGECIPRQQILELWRELERKQQHKEAIRAYHVKLVDHYNRSIKLLLHG